VALKGNVGGSVSCEIYDSRPSPCQEFQAGGELCLRARQKHGVDSPITEFCP
jgi:Fe-S-cluster containining protein